MIAKKTKMQAIPRSCSACLEGSCIIPFTANNELMSDYILKRHPRCPLIEVEDDIKWLPETPKKRGETHGVVYKRKSKKVSEQQEKPSQV
jgi:hypothetical protein